jgi:1-acyl-sn-glycerol-3-phosphate acyltransferase
VRPGLEPFLCKPLEIDDVDRLGDGASLVARAASDHGFATGRRVACTSVAPAMAPPAAAPEPFTRTYRLAMAIASPLAPWGRMHVEGLDVLPRSGPVLAVANHDSQSDPVVIGVAARRRRQIRALAKRELWDKPGLGRVLDGMGQIPIERAAGDADALVNAIDALRRGSCVGVFPEGTVTCGRPLRARSGVGRLALEVPSARLVCIAVQGTTDYVRLPKRPTVSLRFFEPASGQTDPSEQPAELAQRLLDEIRAIAPRVPAGRDPDKTLAQYEAKAAAHEQKARERREAAERDAV